MTALAYPAPTRADTLELERLEDQERTLSRIRRELRAEIDRLYLAAPLHAAQIARLDELENQERVVSSRRRTIHYEIDHLRMAVGL
jgi:hypothetical protein